MDELKEQIQKVLAESTLSTLKKHKVIMRLLIDLRFELEAQRKIREEEKCKVQE